MTDYLRKYKSLYASTASSFGTGTSETITLASVTGLPTDTEITLTFDRVDSAGTATPTKMERITGTISGSTLISYTRGVDGTTEQAHTSPVVEMIWNADDWNEAIDGILVEHNITGTHKAALVTTLKAAASDVTTGTNDTKIVTPKAIKDATLTLTSPVINTGVSGTAVLDENDMASDSNTQIATQQSIKAYVDGKATALSSKIIASSRDATAASGDVSYTGVGFQPTAVFALVMIDNIVAFSIGMADSTKAGKSLQMIADTKSLGVATLISYGESASAKQSAIIKSYDADGFTLTWTKTGSPSGSFAIYFLCFK